MKELDVFGVSRKNPTLDVAKASFGYFRLPQNINGFFKSFLFLMDEEHDYYFYGENNLCSKFTVKFVGNEMVTVKLKDFKNIKVLRSIVGSYSSSYEKRIKIYYNSDENYLVEKFEKLLEINARVLEKCIVIKESIIYCDNVDAIPSTPVPMIIANEIEVFIGYTMKVLTCPKFNINITPSYEHIVNDGSFVIISDTMKNDIAHYEAFR